MSASFSRLVRLVFVGVFPIFPLMAHTPSLAFAPMLVPLRKICLLNTVSCFSLRKYWCGRTILTANLLLFTGITFSPISPLLPFFSFPPFYIVNFKF